MDWSTLQLEHPWRLWLAPAAMLVLALLALAGTRHDPRTRLIAFGLRTVAVAALCVLLAGPVVTRTDSQNDRLQPPWRLLLQPAPAQQGLVDFREPPELFIARVRNALESGAPPRRCEVVGEAESARHVLMALTALGMPCATSQPDGAGGAARAMLLGWNVPARPDPGEPMVVGLRVSGPGLVRLKLDGQELAASRQGDVVRHDGHAPASGRHLLEAELLDDAGRVVQRSGQVLRVADRPVLLVVGLDDTRAAEVARLAPGFAHRRCGTREFGTAQLTGTGLILTTVEALYRMDSMQAFTLAGFVARGGGLYVTGDGARHVPPEFLPEDARALLPVRLLPEPRPDTPPDPPVENRPTIEEVAKVSVCYVLDRSNSMNAPIVTRKGQTTRWQVAVQGVTDSMARLSIDARASVMTFTLKQTWQATPRVFLPFNQEEMSQRLRKLKGDEEYDESFYNTDIYAAVKAAIAEMEKEPSAIKLIIMMTDGADRAANTAAGLRHSDLRDLAISKDINIVAIGIGDAFADSIDSAAAQGVIRDLATRPEFAFMPASAEDAAQAHAIFVNSVETAFKAFDDKKAREEEARRRRLQEQADQQKEPPRIDALKGTWPLALEPLGRALFGADALGAAPPKVQWFARNQPRPDAAVTLSLQVQGEPPPAAMALGAYGLGRTAFWAAGTSSEALGELSGWADFPGLFAASLRWLTPRELPDPRLVGDAGPDGIRLLDPIDGAEYSAIGPSGETVSLQLRDGVLSASQPLAEGAWEVMESVGKEKRGIGDAYVLATAPEFARPREPPHPGLPGELQPGPDTVSQTRRLAEQPVLYLVLLVLMVLPLERYARRRS